MRNIHGASLMYVYQEKCENSAFFKKRFWAIYPMFWLAYIIAFLYNFWVNRGMNYQWPKSRFFLTLFGMDGYLGWFGGNYYLLGEWFLGCLILLYLSFPLLRIGVKKFPGITVAVAAILYVFGMVLNILIKQEGMPLECYFFMRIPEMLFGMYFVQYIKKTNRIMLFGSIAVLIGGAVLNLQGIPAIHVTIIVGIATFLVLVFVSKYIEFELIKKICDIISKYSYAIFLTHHFIFRAVIIPHFSGITLSRSENYFLFIISIIGIAVVSDVLLKMNDKICLFLKKIKKKMISDTKVSGIN